MYIIRGAPNIPTARYSDRPIFFSRPLKFVSREPIIPTPQYSDTYKPNIPTHQYSDTFTIVVFIARIRVSVRVLLGQVWIRISVRG